MKRFYRILSVILCLAMFIPVLATVVFAATPENTKASATTPDAPEELASLSSYLHASASTEDNTSHLPVNVHTYYDENKTYTPNTIGVKGSVIIMYVMNTNTERLGNKSDAELVQSFLDRGFFVLVLDYMDNPEACGTALDWSTQDIRCQVIGGNSFAAAGLYKSGTFTDGKLVGEDPICSQAYILPAGYDIAYDIPYFSYDKHGVAGTFENIVEIWNTDFKSVKRNTIVKWVDENGMPRLDRTEAITAKAPQDSLNRDYATWFKTADGRNGISQAALAALSAEEQKQYQYTYIGNTKVVDVTDCVQPDGTMIELNLYFDIIYPSDYVGDSLPVMVAMSSSYTRASTWTSETRPYLNGPLFNGYVGVVSDYGLVPMCRNDHYGYFCGDSQLNSVSGDNGTYSLSYYNGIHSDTALLRTLRMIGAEGMDVEGYGRVCAPINPEKIGAYGNSKAGVIVRLANPTPEKLEELRHYAGHMGETRLEAFEGSYPYVDPYLDASGNTTDSRISAPEAQPVLTYSNGETIHSGLNFVFANCGGASNTLTKGSAPIFGVGTQAGKAEGSYYTYYTKTANYARNLNIPFFGLVAPKIAHDLGYGLDKDYGIDILEAFNTYADYWLKDDSPECIIVDVDTTNDIWVASDVIMDNVYEIGEDSSIKLQFTGPIPAYEIEKVQIYNVATGEQLRGEWYGSYGDQQWKFIPYDIEDASYYTVLVPDDICATNGQALKETVTHTFRTGNGITEDAVSITLPKTNIASYDCVNKGFSVAAAGYTLDQSTYKFYAFKGAGTGLEIDLRAINDTNGINDNQNVRLPVLDEIWADAKYIGQTITVSFEAKASEAGWVKLALNQHGNGNYVWGNGWQLISSRTDLTTEWQTITFQFVVTEELFAARANSTSATPDITLGVRFSGFITDGKYTDAVVNFRNFTTSYVPKAENPSLNNVNDTLFFNFADKDYSTAHNITLRFAVANDAINTVGVYKVSGGTIGEKLGEVTVAGAGIYNFDVTDYIKSCNGAPTVAVKIEEAVGTTVVNSADHENGTSNISFNAISKAVISTEAKNADGSDNTSIKYEYMAPMGRYVDLNNNLVSEYVGSISNFATSYGIKGAPFNEADYGRRFRVTFRVYDETSRVISVSTGRGYNFDESVNDYRGTEYSFYTTAGEWTTVTFELTIDDEILYGDILNKRLLYFEAENKSLTVLDENVTVNPSNMATATTKPGNYAGAPGLNESYTVYKNVDALEAADAITLYDDLSYAIYFDDLVFEEITTGVTFADTLPMLSITPTTTEDILPTVAASVLSTDPDAAQDGLWISGGKDGFDTKSVKSYVKLSLADYFGGFSAFYFKATGTGDANVSVYGVADVQSGEAWSSDTINSSNAPANDIYSSGVNLNAVWGNKPLATFKVGVGETGCLVELTEFADEMLAKGAKEITIILVSDSAYATQIDVVGLNEETLKNVASFDGVTVRPAMSGAGFSNLDESTYSFYVKNDEGVGFDLRTAYKDTVKATSNGRIEIFNNVWASPTYVGKTIRFSFSAKSTIAGSVELGLNQRQKYAFNNFPGFSATADLTTDWQTFEYEFVVTQEMYDIITSGSDANGIQPPGLALGVHFVGFNDGTGKYKGAQILFRNFYVFEVVPDDSEIVTRVSYIDGINQKPTAGGAGFSLDTSTYSFNYYNSEGIGVDLRTAHKDTVKTTSNAKFEIFNDIWADTSYVGKTIRFSFSAKSTIAGSVELGLNQRQKYAFNNFPGFSATADLTTDWQTFEYEFVVTQEMYDIITSGSDANGIQPPGLALGVHFAGFNDGTGKYKGAQITFRDFTVSTVEYKVEEDEAAPILNQYDFVKSQPDVTASGYSGSNLWATVDGALEFYAGKITNGNSNQNFRISAFNNIFGTNTHNIGKTFRVIFKAKSTVAGRLDVSLNTGTGGKGNPAKPNGAFDIYPDHTWAFDLSEEYQTYTFTFVALEGMYDTTSYATIQLGIRLFNGFYGDASYKDATISIDDLVVVEDPYVRSVDVNYDFSTNVPTADFRGYSTQIGAVNKTTGELEINLASHSSAPNSGQYARVAALQQIWANKQNLGKTFTIEFTAKSTIAGAVDFAINKTGTWDNYSFGGTTYTTRYNFTTEYQTFRYTFTVVDDMFTTNASTTLDCAFRFYNGFNNNGAYLPAMIYIDNMRVYEELTIDKSTLDVTDSVAISGSGNSEMLNVYADASATGAPKIRRTYVSYDLSKVTTVYGSRLAVNLQGVNGESVKVYVLPGTTLSSPVTYANAPVPTGAPAASFVAVNGMNYVDISEAIAESVGKNVVIVLAIEEPSDDVQITATPTLKVVKEYHNYTSDSQKHEAKAPTYKAPGNVEFYTCEGCDKLYVKNGADFVEVTIDDVILPMLECTEHNFVDGTCTNCGEKETHVCSGGTATCQKRAECSTCGKEYGELAPHTEETVSAVAPTCTATGLTEGKKCSVCDTVTVAQTEVAALGHSYSATVTEPTCTAGGYTTYTCSVCNHSYVANQTEANGHTEETIPEVAPTCTATGLSAGKQCTVCGEVTLAQIVVDALGHTETTIPAVAPTCTATGLTEGKKCTVCGVTTVAQTEVAALGHTETTIPAVDPTCTETGLTAGKKCTVCGVTTVAQTEVAALGHTEITIPAVDPTCTETGLTAGKKCTVCGVTTVAQTEVAALGHTETTVPAVAPTCTATGLTEGKKCSVCGTTTVEQSTVPATGHTEETLSAVAPTCTETGLTEGKKCSVCGTVTVAQTEVAALGHTEETIPAVAPTCTATGLTEGKKCTVCGVTTVAQTEVAAHGHIETEFPAKAPTCDETGLTEGKQCTVCLTVTVEQTVVDALGHDWNDGEEGHRVCATCGTNEADTIPETPAPTVPKNHDECTASELELFINAILNFLRELFGLPTKCICGDDL